MDNKSKIIALFEFYIIMDILCYLKHNNSVSTAAIIVTVNTAYYHNCRHKTDNIILGKTLNGVAVIVRKQKTGGSSRNLIIAVSSYFSCFLSSVPSVYKHE